MRVDVGRLSYEELYKALEGTKMAARGLARKGANVVLELELNDAPRAPAWDLGVAAVTY